jgi:hypothetical protein
MQVRELSSLAYPMPNWAGTAMTYLPFFFVRMHPQFAGSIVVVTAFKYL